MPWRKMHFAFCPLDCKIRFSSRKILGIFIVSFLYYHINLYNFAWYNQNTVHPCITPQDKMDQLVSLAKDTNTVLDSLGLHHFLVYGSLWGSLRYNAPLPWDNDFDYGVTYNEITKYPKQKLIEEFKRYGINSYYSSRFGFFRVTRGSARGDIMIYDDYYKTGWMQRIGWEAYVFFVNYRRYHTFPGHLIELPMPRVLFGTFNISVPHSGVEFQKYLYPNDWWLIRKPIGCT